MRIEPRISLVFNGDCDAAEELARAALAIDPLDVRAQHVMAHVFEMTDRPAEGLGWMREHAAREKYLRNTHVATEKAVREKPKMASFRDISPLGKKGIEQRRKITDQPLPESAPEPSPEPSEPTEPSGPSELSPAA